MGTKERGINLKEQKYQEIKDAISEVDIKAVIGFGYTQIAYDVDLNCVMLIRWSSIENGFRHITIDDFESAIKKGGGVRIKTMQACRNKEMKGFPDMPPYGNFSLLEFL